MIASNKFSLDKNKSVFTGISVTNDSYDNDSLTDARDRDGSNTALNIAYNTTITNDWQLTIGGGIEKNSADGDDYDFDQISLFAALNKSITLDLSNGEVPMALNFQLTHASSDYDNPNSFTGFTFSRDDDLTQLGMGVSWEVREGMDAFVQFTHINNSSNIPEFNYDRNRVVTGIAFTWQRNK